MAINNGTRPRYALVGEDGETYSADPGDYWYMADDEPIDFPLVRTNHVYRLAIDHDRIATSWRILRQYPTVRDLRRLDSAIRRTRKVA